MTSILDAVTEEFTTPGTTPTSSEMSSRTTVSDLSSLWTTEMMTSTYTDDVLNLSTKSSALSFSKPDNTTFTDSTTMFQSNSSFASIQNDSQVVDLESLNKDMALSLMPTIVYLAVLMVVGAVGNTVAFLVYYRRFKPSATRTYILAMSVCDFLANVLSLPSEIIDIRYTFTFDLPWLCKSVRFFNSFLTLTSAFVLVAVARDRFKKICHPLKKQRPLKRIKLYVLICALASLALSIVFGALNGSKSVPTGVGNSTGITCSVSDVFKDTLFPLIYNVIMALAFITCVTIMTVSYIRIALELWRHKKKQARVSEAGPITKAPKSAKGHGKLLHAVVEDTSSGPIHDSQHSEAKSSSSGELIPLKTALPTNKAVKYQTTPAGGSDKQIMLLSIKNLNYDGPSSPVEDSDEGCFSACSMETTSTSVEISKDGHALLHQEARGDSALGDFQTQTTKDIQDQQNSVKSDTEPDSAQVEEVESAQNNSGQVSGATSKESRDKEGPDQTKTSDSSHADDKQVSGNPARIADPHNISPAEHSPPTLHRNTVDRSPSLLQKLLTPRTPRKRHHDIGPGKPARCQIPKKRGTVKSIPSSTTLMMFVLTATFIVNYLPHLIIISLRAMSDTFGEGLTGSMLNAYNIGLRSYFMNCAANSLVYGFCSARFRQECRLLFSRK